MTRRRPDSQCVRAVPAQIEPGHTIRFVGAAPLWDGAPSDVRVELGAEYVVARVDAVRAGTAYQQRRKYRLTLGPGRSVTLADTVQVLIVPPADPVHL